MVILQVTLTTLLKVYARGHLFEKSQKLLSELETLGYAEDEVVISEVISSITDYLEIYYFFLYCFTA